MNRARKKRLMQVSEDIESRPLAPEAFNAAFESFCESGELQNVDSTSLASLTAGCIAATGGLAKIVGEEEFPTHFHQGSRDNLHITLVDGRMILMVIFDERSSLGLVRLRVKKAGSELARIFEEVKKKSELEGAQGGSPFAEITDDDIDNLFSD